MEMTRAEQAKKYFTDGYNCAQSVALAFADLSGIDTKKLAALSSSFGGGMGRLREVCGAVTGMFMIWGFINGYSDAETGDRKKEHYADIQELARRFKEKNGTIICRELLDLPEGADDPTPEARTEKYYHKRPCADMVYSAAEILDEFIKEKKK